MAEEKKKEAEKPKSKGQKRYGEGPKIEKAPAKGDTNESGSEQGAKKEAEDTADGGTTKATMDADPGPEGTEAAGTGDIPVRHAGERKEMVARHEEEMAQMHKRHAKEHRKMNRRHMSEMGTEQESPEEDAGEAGEE